MSELHGHHATQLVQSSRRDGATPLPAGSGPARAGAPRVWAPLPSRYLAGAEQRRGGRNAALRRAGPGSGRGPACVGATAVTLLGWRRAAEGSVQCRSPSGRARLGQWPHVCVCHGRHATRMVPSSRGEGATPLPAGRALLLPGSHACGHHCHHAARLLPSSGGEGATPLPAGSSPAVTRAGSHVCGRHGRHATRLAPSSGGDGATPLPAGPRPASIGAPRV